MFNDRGQPVVIAQPGAPVEVIGWRDLPSAGEEILEVDTEVRLTVQCTVTVCCYMSYSYNSDSALLGCQLCKSLMSSYRVNCFTEPLVPNA